MRPLPGAEDVIVKRQKSCKEFSIYLFIYFFTLLGKS